MKFINRLRTTALASVLSLTVAFSMPVQAAQSDGWQSWPTGPSVAAESAIVMEASTGTILYAKDIDTQRFPASITKIMTVLLALENCEMDEEVTFSHNAVFSIDYNSSHIARDEGEILTVEECLYAIMLESANECSNAIAEHIAGSTEAFAEMMNARAAELGCTNTHFVNPHGLPNDNHYTSARDMALITREAIKHEKFRQISSTARYTLRATNKKDQELLMNNHHYMICAYKTSKFLDDTVFVGKTGYTSVALNTLVTCATRHGMDLIVVTLKTASSGQKGVPLYTDTASLLDYAGENFHKVNISQNEQNFTLGQNDLFDTGTSVFGSTAPLITMNTDGYIVLPVTADFTDATPKLEFSDTENSSVIATLSYTFAGQTVGSTDLELTPVEIQEFQFQKTTGDESEPVKERLIKINLRIVVVIALIIAAITSILLILKKLSKEYKIDLSFLRKRRRKRRPERNSFVNQNRRRYRSKKLKNRNRKY